MTLDTLCWLLQRHQHSASQAECSDDSALAELMRMGLIDNTGLASTVICNACDQSHPANIIFDPAEGELGWHCPDYGFVASPEDERRNIRALPSRLAEMTADALGCNRRLKRPLLDGMLWRIGAFEIGNNDIMVFLALRLRDASDARNVATAMSAEPSIRNGLILTPNFSGSPALSIAGCKIAALSELVSVEDGKLIAVTYKAADLAGVRIKSRVGAPFHNGHDEAEALIRKRYRDGNVENSDRDEAKIIASLLKDSAPGDRKLRTMISEVRAGQ